MFVTSHRTPPVKVCKRKTVSTVVHSSIPLFSKTTHALTGVPAAKCIVYMLSCRITRVFLYLVIFLSQYYYFPNNLHLVPAEILHNTTQVHLNYEIKNLLIVSWYHITHNDLWLALPCKYWLNQYTLIECSIKSSNRTVI